VQEAVRRQGIFKFRPLHKLITSLLSVEAFLESVLRILLVPLFVRPRPNRSSVSLNARLAPLYLTSLVTEAEKSQSDSIAKKALWKVVFSLSGYLQIAPTNRLHCRVVESNLRRPNHLSRTFRECELHSDRLQKAHLMIAPILVTYCCRPVTSMKCSPSRYPLVS